MKLRIYKQPDYIGIYQIMFWLKRIGFSEDYCHKLATKIDNKFPSIDDFLLKVHKKRERKDKIKVEYFDTWSADITLAKIIVPVLTQLRNTVHGSPMYDMEDVPEEYRTSDTDDPKFHDGWLYIIDEMIYGFQYALDMDEEEDYKIVEARVERAKNGRKLFAKYFQALWD